MNSELNSGNVSPAPVAPAQPAVAATSPAPVAAQVTLSPVAPTQKQRTPRRGKKPGAPAPIPAVPGAKL